MKGILSAVRQLEPLGAEVLKGWATALVEQVEGSGWMVWFRDHSSSQRLVRQNFFGLKQILSGERSPKNRRWVQECSQCHPCLEEFGRASRVFAQNFGAHSGGLWLSSPGRWWSQYCGGGSKRCSAAFLEPALCTDGSWLVVLIWLCFFDCFFGMVKSPCLVVGAVASLGWSDAKWLPSVKQLRPSGWRRVAILIFQLWAVVAAVSFHRVEWDVGTRPGGWIRPQTHVCQICANWRPAQVDRQQELKCVGRNMNNYFQYPGEPGGCF